MRRDPPTPPYEFDPARHEEQLVTILREIERCPRLSREALDRILRRHPKEGKAFFSQSELLRGFRYLAARQQWTISEETFCDALRTKPIRTLSGVAPLSVLTHPFPCPGACIFCPREHGMPTSYMPAEPGAQRAARSGFDPYVQSGVRVQTFRDLGHQTDKIELIILGGTWSHYPEPYQVWFVKRCLDALNAHGAAVAAAVEPDAVDTRRALQLLAGTAAPNADRLWAELGQAQRANESAACRCVGLSLETRPDHVTAAELVRMRRLGATKVQIGLQSLDDEILALNRRGHDVAASRRAVRLLRQAGFKIHAHWMPNLLGSTPQRDVADFRRLFADRDFRPDELKIYPCTLVASAALMERYAGGQWIPYRTEELVAVLAECLRAVPEYCRVTRVVRDIASHDIVAGNRETNLRQRVERALADRGQSSRDIRSREIRRTAVRPEHLTMRVADYETSAGRELFLQLVTMEDRIAAFLRLSLPSAPSFVEELRESALLREVHVYGSVAGLGAHPGGAAQHIGLGRELIWKAAEHARAAGCHDLAVISAIGTRPYYRGLGFEDGPLYQHLPLDPETRHSRLPRDRAAAMRGSARNARSISPRVRTR